MRKIVLEPERERLTRVERRTWAREEAAGRAPKRIKLSPRRNGWDADEIAAWIEQRAAERDART